MYRGLFKSFLLGSLLLTLSAAATDAQGALLAHDSYLVGQGEYSATGLDGQTSSSAIGFTGTWDVSTANLGAVAGGDLDGDSDPTLTSNGQGEFIPATGIFSEFFRSARRTLETVPTPANSTYYMSHVLRAGPLVGENQDFALVGFGSFFEESTVVGVLGSLFGAFTGFAGDGSGGLDLIIRSRTSEAPGGILDTVLATRAENTTYQVVMALEFNNPGDVIRYWVNPTDFDQGEAGLSSTAIASGAIPGFQLGSPADLNRLSIVTHGFDRTFAWDESGLGTEVADLEPSTAIVPEPTALLLAACCLLLTGRSRQ